MVAKREILMSRNRIYSIICIDFLPCKISVSYGVECEDDTAFWDIAPCNLKYTDVSEVRIASISAIVQYARLKRRCSSIYTSHYPGRLSFAYLFISWLVNGFGPLTQRLSIAKFGS
jgi:hypothetical protein